MWNASTRADACCVAEGSEPSPETTLVVFSVARVERIARPRAPPICCDVLSSPKARPASPDATPVVAISVTGTKVGPMPTEMSTKPGRRSTA
jgi:hypothetical protein